MRYPLDPQKEIFKWGPTPATLLNFDCFGGVFKKTPQTYPGYEWPKSLTLVAGGRFVYMSELDAMLRGSKKWFIERMLIENERSILRRRWDGFIEQFHNFQSEIASEDLSSLTDRELQSLWEKYEEYISYFWLYGSPPEYANYGSVEILEEKLKSFVPNDAIAVALEVLTAPESLSFYQQEEIELIRTNDISAHQRKYFWINNSYAHVEVLSKQTFLDRKQEIDPHIIEEARARIETVRKAKTTLTKQYDLPETILEMARVIVFCIEWQDERKAQIWTYLHYLNLLIDEIARRYRVSKDDLSYYLMAEVTGFMQGKRDLGDMSDRRKGVGVLCDIDVVETIHSDAVGKYWDLYVTPRADERINEFKGIVACRGNGPTEGTVRIVLDPRKADHFKKGDILVTTMTAPEYVFLMKRAAGIITDTGGLMSHAAVVSREFNIPAIVGTKIATAALKDGDRITIDTDVGLVRIIRQ